MLNRNWENNSQKKKESLQLLSLSFSLFLIFVFIFISDLKTHTYPVPKFTTVILRKKHKRNESTYSILFIIFIWKVTTIIFFGKWIMNINLREKFIVSCLLVDWNV